MSTLMYELVAQALADCGAVSWGFVDIAALTSYLPRSGRMRQRFDLLRESYETALVAAFALYAGPEDSHIILCARAGADYTHMGKARLTHAFEALKPLLGERGRATGNGYPLPIVHAARLAGVGMTGRHGLCIVPPYGSYVSLGAIVWRLSDDIRAALPRRAPAGGCTACDTDGVMRCHVACPTGALSWTDTPDGAYRKLSHARCCSHINQKKGVLTPLEERRIRQTPYVWGCDLCQRACPYNQQPERTTLPELLTDRVGFVTLAEVEAGAHDHRPFTRQGRGIILRNLELFERTE